MRALFCFLAACGGGGGGGGSDAKPDAPGIDSSMDADTCAGAAGPVTVRTKVGYTLVFHDRGGAIVKSLVTSSPSTTEMLAPCGMVTVAKPKGVVTITDVMPGETINVGIEKPAFTDPRGITITFPTNGTQREFRTGQPGCAFQSSTSPVTLQIPAQCRTPAGTIDMLAIDRATDDAIAGFAPISAAPGGSVTINAFRTDFGSSFMTVAALPSGLTRFATVRTLIDQMDPEAIVQSQSLPATLPIIPGARSIVTLGGTSGEETLSGTDVLAQPLDSSILFDTNIEIPFRVTNVDASGSPPTATWTTTGSLDGVDLAIACLEWFDTGEFEWCIYVDPSKHSVKFPAMPPGILPSAPHGTHGAVLVDTSVLDGWSAAHRDALNRFGLVGGLRYPTNLRVREAIAHPALYESFEL